MIATLYVDATLSLMLTSNAFSLTFNLKSILLPGNLRRQVALNAVGPRVAKGKWCIGLV